MTRENILNTLKTVEHPEIAVSLVDLGMILDVVVEDNTARIAVALPMLDVPDAVREAIVNVISEAIQESGLELHMEYFEMMPDVRDNFFVTAKANWKGAI